MINTNAIHAQVKEGANSIMPKASATPIVDVYV
jgi:hypothetical protein